LKQINGFKINFRELFVLSCAKATAITRLDEKIVISSFFLLILSISLMLSFVKYHQEEKNPTQQGNVTK
jgi:hypothetical protein